MGPTGGVSTGHPLTTSAALAILLKGGNAFDAGVASLLVGGVLEKWGTMTFEQVAASAIAYAESGFPMRPTTYRAIQNQLTFFEKWPGNKTYWLKPDGSLYKPGDTIKLPTLARTLKRDVGMCDGGDDRSGDAESLCGCRSAAGLLRDCVPGRLAGARRGARRLAAARRARPSTLLRPRGARTFGSCGARPSTSLGARRREQCVYQHRF